jgi:hypothetical protein
VADELARWAAERAPGLLARAEADAVAILRDALVGGVLRQRARGRAPPRLVAGAPAPRLSLNLNGSQGRSSGPTAS